MWPVAVLLALAPVASDAPPQPDAVAVKPNGLNRQASIRLAEALYPRVTVQTFISQAAADSLAIEFAREPELKKLEQTYPGLRAAILERLPDVLDQQVDDQLPALYSSMSDQLTNSMSVGQIRDALAFMEGPEGQALMRADTDYVIRNYLKEGPFSPSSAKELVNGVKPSPVKDPRVAQWANANLVVGPAIKAWVDKQREINNQALGELVGTIIAEFVDRVPT